MEGISHEACSLAGTLGLAKLTVVYDDNGISIDGEVDGWFTDDTPARFEAYGWNVIRDVDGHDVEAVHRALEAAKRETARPTLICAKTIIGKGAATKCGTADCHGAALGDKEVAATREALGWPHAAFVIPPDDQRRLGCTCAAAPHGRRTGASASKPIAPRIRSSRAEFERRIAGRCPTDFAAIVERVRRGAEREGRDRSRRARRRSRRSRRTRSSCPR